MKFDFSYFSYMQHIKCIPQLLWVVWVFIYASIHGNVRLRNNCDSKIDNSMTFSSSFEARTKMLFSWKSLRNLRLLTVCHKYVKEYGEFRNADDGSPKWISCLRENIETLQQLFLEHVRFIRSSASRVSVSESGQIIWKYCQSVIQFS